MVLHTRRKLTWEVDGQRFTAGAGTSAFAPRGTAHAYQNIRDEAAHILVMLTPAGLDQFFEDVTAQNKGLSQPDFARVDQLMQSTGWNCWVRRSRNELCRCAVLHR